MNKSNRGREYIGDAWWLFIIEGIANVTFGAFVLFFPTMTANLLVISAAIYCVIIGMLGLVHGLSGLGYRRSWWMSAIFSIVVLGVGGYLLFHSDIGLATLSALAGILLIWRGTYALIIGIIFSNKIELRWLWISGGVLGIISGFVVWSSGSNMGVSFDKALGWYLLPVAGPISIGYALWVRKLPDS